MGFKNADLMAKIRGFLGLPSDQSMVSLILRTFFLYGLFTSLFRYVFPKKVKPCFDSEASEKALMADNKIDGVSDNAVDREELRRVFSTFDKNGDGLISQQEMKESFEKLRLCIGEEELLHTIRTVDLNGDGHVDFDEFVMLYESVNAKGGEEKEAMADHMEGEGYLAEAFGCLLFAVRIIACCDLIYIESVSMGFKNADLMAEIRGFLGFPSDQSMVSLILRTVFLYGLFTSLFRYVFPKKIRPCFDSEASEKALKADNKIDGFSDNAVDREELRRVFSTFDKNDDGLISQQEMKESFGKLRLCIGDDELLHTIRTVDLNGDGHVDFDEFVTLYESMSGKEGEEKEAMADHMDGEGDLAEAFGVFDVNGDGLITVEELQSVLRSLDLKEGRTIGDCKKMIQKVDKDGDGMVNYLEFKEMMSAGFGKI